MPVVEITGVNFVNKGAELMLHAVVAACSESGLALEPALALRHGNFVDRRRAGVRHLLRIGAPKASRVDGAFASVAGLAPSILTRAFSLAREKDVSAVLDASGFAYSDQWGSLAGRAAVRHVRRWKTSGRRFVLLPQALGPFESRGAREVMLDILELADLVFARDEVSLRHVTSLGAADHVRLAPDFTNLLTPPEWPGDDALEGRVVVIPNLRMVDVGRTVEQETYVQGLTHLVERVRRAGFECTVMAHETNDRAIVQEVARRSGVPAIVEPDALRIKALMRHPRLVVSSRFHGIVNALSQGTPAVGVGWSHKYAELFRDYGAEDCLARSIAVDGDTVDIVLRELDDDAQLVRRNQLRQRSEALKAATRRMWRDVFEVVDAGP